MATTINSGLVDDSDILSNERVIDMSDVVDTLESDFTQFTTALMKVRSKPATSTKVEWLEDVLFPRKSALAASATSSATSISVTADEGVYFNVGDLVRNTLTGEAYEVTGVTTDSVGVTRSIGSVAAASSASANAELIIVANAALQGARAPTAKVTERVAAYNYTQIVRQSYSFTRSLTQSKVYVPGGELMYERKKKAVEHKRALEAMFFLGARDLDTGGSEPQGFCGGAIEYISTNVHDAAGTMASSSFEGFMETDLQYGSESNKVLFAAPRVSRVLSSYPLTAWTRATPGNSLWGVKVDGFISGAFGYEVPVFVKREWGEFSKGTASQMGSKAFLIDMDSVRIRPLQPTVLLRNRQDNDADRVTEEYLTEASLEFQHEKKHALLINITG
jgi:hypothetical protein